MKLIVIVGGSGLGSALVQRLLEEDCRVVVAGRTKPVDARVRKFYAIDATAVDWRSLYATIQEETATPIDAVIFVAEIAVFGRTALIPPEQARQTFELNFWGCTTAAKTVAEHWVDRNQAGKFLAVLWISARRAIPFETYYSASKAARARFVESLQPKYEHKNMEFVCTFPGLLRGFRRQASWHGVEPTFADHCPCCLSSIRAFLDLLKGRRRARVIGWRERSIEVADRLLPGPYDRTVWQRRVQRLLR